MTSTFPILRLKRNEDRRISAGHLWVFSNEVDTQATPLSGFAPGDVCELRSARDQSLGLAYVNPQTLTSGAFLRATRSNARNAVARTFCRALTLRQRHWPCRSIDSSAASRTAWGLVLDRFGGVSSRNRLSMEARRAIAAAVQEVLSEIDAMEETAGAEVEDRFVC
jgi:23S rRNA (cytosine1962-C5)-methyltransferase